MQSGKLISVIVAVYNVEKYLDNALESLKKQTIGFNNLEIIFCDDFSDDNSMQILNKFADEYSNIIVLRQPENSGGCGYPRNSALKVATSEYIAFFDPDDELPENAYKIMYDKNSTINSEIVTGYYSLWDNNHNVIDAKCGELGTINQDKQFDLPESLRDALSTAPMLCCKLYKRLFLLENGIKFLPFVGEDQPFVINCYLCAQKVTYINEEVYRYIQRSDSLSQKRTEKYFYGLSECMLECEKLFNEYDQRDICIDFIGNLLEEQLKKLAMEDYLPTAEVLSFFNYFKPFFINANYCKGDLCKSVFKLNKESAKKAVEFVLLSAPLIKSYNIALGWANDWRNSFQQAVLQKEEQLQNLTNVINDKNGQIKEQLQSSSEIINNKNIRIQEMDIKILKLNDKSIQLENLNNELHLLNKISENKIKNLKNEINDLQIKNFDYESIISRLSDEIQIMKNSRAMKIAHFLGKMVGRK